jgi:hypothetical protein
MFTTWQGPSQMALRLIGAVAAAQLAILPIAGASSIMCMHELMFDACFCGLMQPGAQ